MIAMTDMLFSQVYFRPLNDSEWFYQGFWRMLAMALALQLQIYECHLS